MGHAVKENFENVLFLAYKDVAFKDPCICFFKTVLLLLNLPLSFSDSAIQEIMTESNRVNGLEISIKNTASCLETIFNFLSAKDFQWNTCARDFAFAIGRVYQSALLIEHAAHTMNNTDIYAAQSSKKVKFFKDFYWKTANFTTFFF